MLLSHRARALFLMYDLRLPCQRPLRRGPHAARISSHSVASRQTNAFKIRCNKCQVIATLHTLPARHLCCSPCMSNTNSKKQQQQRWQKCSMAHDVQKWTSRGPGILGWAARHGRSSWLADWPNESTAHHILKTGSCERPKTCKAPAAGADGRALAPLPPTTRPMGYRCSCSSKSSKADRGVKIESVVGGDHWLLSLVIGGPTQQHAEHPIHP